MAAYTGSLDAEFIILHEDDFSVCSGTWPWIEDALHLASEHNGCGLFLATGGAGLAIKRSIVPEVLPLLLDMSVKEPADVKIQNCLRGRYSEYCRTCRNKNLLVASHLVFRHTGFVSSLKHNYKKSEGRWACGYRHAFNGDPDAEVLHTDENILYEVL
jgi:hypothetical protein